MPRGQRGRYRKGVLRLLRMDPREVAHIVNEEGYPGLAERLGISVSTARKGAWAMGIRRVWVLARDLPDYARGRYPAPPTVIPNGHLVQMVRLLNSQGIHGAAHELGIRANTLYIQLLKAGITTAFLLEEDLPYYLRSERAGD